MTDTNDTSTVTYQNILDVLALCDHVYLGITKSAGVEFRFVSNVLVCELRFSRCVVSSHVLTAETFDEIFRELTTRARQMTDDGFDIPRVIMHCRQIGQ